MKNTQIDSFLKILNAKKDNLVKVPQVVKTIFTNWDHKMRPSQRFTWEPVTMAPYEFISRNRLLIAGNNPLSSAHFLAYECFTLLKHYRGPKRTLCVCMWGWGAGGRTLLPIFNLLEIKTCRILQWPFHF